MTRFGATFGIYMDSGLSAPVTKQAIQELELNVGENAYASFKATAVHDQKMKRISGFVKIISQP